MVCLMTGHFRFVALAQNKLQIRPHRPRTKYFVNVRARPTSNVRFISFLLPSFVSLIFRFQSHGIVFQYISFHTWNHTIENVSVTHRILNHIDSWCYKCLALENHRSVRLLSFVLACERSDRSRRRQKTRIKTTAKKILMRDDLEYATMCCKWCPRDHQHIAPFFYPFLGLHWLYRHLIHSNYIVSFALCYLLSLQIHCRQQ